METNERNKELLARFNTVERTLAGIWEAVGGVCPFEVRRYDQGEDASVLVTRICKGVAYGFPLKKGLRERNEWYRPEDAGSVRIPEGGTAIWTLVDMPYDDMGKILFRLDLNGTIDVKADTAKKAYAAVTEETDSQAVITFGKYRGKTVAEVLKKDPGYISWALENIPAFREQVLVKAKAA